MNKKGSKAQYPKGYWTRVIGGYSDSSFGLPTLDQARRPVENAVNIYRTPGGKSDAGSKSQEQGSRKTGR